MINLETKEVSTLQLSGLTEQLSETTILQSMIPSFENTLDLPAQTVKPDAEVLLKVNVRLDKTSTNTAITVDYLVKQP